MTDAPNPPAGEERLEGELGDEGAGPGEDEDVAEKELAEPADSEGGDAG